MRSFLTGWVIAITAAALPTAALASNQEIADAIAKNLRSGGQLSDYKIGVKYQDGTAWLAGHVRSPQQMNAALTLAFKNPNVKRVVNNLAVGSGRVAVRRTASSTAKSKPSVKPQTAPRPIRPVAGALAPERSSLASGRKVAVAGAVRFSQAQTTARPSAPRSANRAEQVPSSFETGPVEKVAAAIRQVTEPVKRALAPVQQVAPTQPRAMPRAMRQVPAARVSGGPIPVAYSQVAPAPLPAGSVPGGPIPAYVASGGGGVAPARYDQPHMPNYAWPSYAAYPNYGALTYPRQYSPTAWPFIGPFYPYPQVPLGWRKVTLEWDDGWWMLDFKD